MRVERVRTALHARPGYFRKQNTSIAALLFALAAVGAAVPVAGASTGVAMPLATVAQVDLPDEPAVFGTVPIPVRVRPTSTRWSRIMRASLDQPALYRLTSAAGDLPPQAQAAFVQTAVNQAVHNRSPSYDCSDDGYWAAANETLGRGVGDCIDIAIAKMEALRLLGIPSRDLYLTTGYTGAAEGPGKGRQSAALLVRIGEGFWLLTERTDHAIEAGGPLASQEFAPIVTYGVGKTWVHGRLVRTAQLSPESATVRTALRGSPTP